MKNFEKQIKDQLEQREIQPTDHAWFAITEGLEHSKPKAKSKRKAYVYFAVGLAAGLALFFSLQVLFFPSSGRINSAQPQIAQPALSNPLQTSQPVLAVSNQLKSNNKIQRFSPVIKTQALPIIRYRIDTSEEIEGPAVNNSTLAESLLAEVEIELSQDSNSEEITEVEALLAKAKSNLKFNQSTLLNSVSAQDLLAEIEAEADDENFRHKVWDAIKLKLNQAQEAFTQL